MRPWTELRERVGTWPDALVIGNGPSREGLGALTRETIGRRCLVVACNAYWREDPAQWRRPNVLVCYDGAQSELSQNWCLQHGVALVVPEQRDTAVRFVGSHGMEQATFEAAPHYGTAIEQHFLSWSPGIAPALGNLSGLLAYQAALLCGAKRVFLLGIDCGGRLSADQVKLSAFGGSVFGYGNDAPAAVCERVADVMVPNGWMATRSLWRALTRRAAELGTATYLAAPGGALDWLEVRTIGS